MDVHANQQSAEATLLDRVRSLRVPRQSGPELAVPDKRTFDAGEPDPAAVLRVLLSDVRRHAHAGVASPSQLFSLLHSTLQVQRGALLVGDGELFSAFATVGLDRTSQRMLRLPRTLVDQIVPDQSVRFVSGSDRNTLAPYLSRNDLRRCGQIAVFPFVHLNRTLAVLMLFDAPILQRDHDIVGLLLTALNAAVAPILFETREKAIARTADAIVFEARQLNEALVRVRTTAEQSHTNPCALRLSIAPLIGAITDTHPHLDPGRVATDVTHTIATLLADVALTIRLDPRTVAVILIDAERVQPHLAVRITVETIRGLFGLRDAPTIDAVEFSLDELGCAH